jgi:FkbM family methyltransferase
MLIPFPKIIEEFKIMPTGVFHLGASTGQEAESYFKCGVGRMVFVEALPDVFQELVRHIAQFPEAKAINACIGLIDGEALPFHVSSNAGESSSLFKFGLHRQFHPDVSFIHDIPVVTTRVATLIQEHGIDLVDYDFLNIDLQGAEMIALQGMEDHLAKIKYVYIEINTDYVYEGIALAPEIDAYLATFGFIKVKEKMTDCRWGDAFYIKSMPH